MLAAADSDESRTGTRGLGDCQRTSSKSAQDRVAIFHRGGSNEVEQALGAGSSGKHQIQRNLNYRVLSNDDGDYLLDARWLIGRNTDLLFAQYLAGIGHSVAWQCTILMHP